jgi:polysaccharide deacetylase family protein (PEP-CTERM system associated)
LTTNQKKYFIFTVDVEDWFQVENFKTSIPFDSWTTQELRVERNVHKMLNLLDEEKEGSRGRGFKGSSETNQPINQSNQFNQPTNQSVVRATFFVLGWIARKLPGLIREIHARGHEVASHGVDHHLCTDQSIDTLRRDLTDSRKLLEDIIGSRVNGYRAPSFSINNDILKIIEDAGYQYDSSYNYFDKHGRYGKLSVNGFLKNGIAYKVSDTFCELPVSNLCLKPIAHSLQPVHSLQPAVLPFGGGGYFRLFPYFVFKKGIQRILRKEDSYSFYLHPWEVDPGQPRVDNAPALLKFRHYINLASTADKIKRMLGDFKDCRFVTCGEYVEAVARERL